MNSIYALTINGKKQGSLLIAALASAMKQLSGWGIVALTILSLSGCAVISVDSHGNRKHSGLMWTRHITENNGQANAVIIKTAGIEYSSFSAGFGLMLGYRKHLFAWPLPLNDSLTCRTRSEKESNSPPNGSRFGFMSVTIPAHQGASLSAVSQTGVNISMGSEYPLLGVGYWSRTKTAYKRNGKAYSLNYVSGKPEELLFREINPVSPP